MVELPNCGTDVEFTDKDWVVLVVLDSLFGKFPKLPGSLLFKPEELIILFVPELAWVRTGFLLPTELVDIASVLLELVVVTLELEEKVKPVVVELEFVAGNIFESEGVVIIDSLLRLVEFIEKPIFCDDDVLGLLVIENADFVLLIGTDDGLLFSTGIWLGKVDTLDVGKLNVTCLVVGDFVSESDLRIGTIEDVEIGDVLIVIVVVDELRDVYADELGGLTSSACITTSGSILWAAKKNVISNYY